MIVNWPVIVSEAELVAVGSEPGVLPVAAAPARYARARTWRTGWSTVLNITWLADANYALTSGDDADGRMSWTAATAWAASLNPYGSGISGWRLPMILDTGSSGCNGAYSGTDCGFNAQTKGGPTVYSEMAHLFYVTLGHVGYYNTAGVMTGGACSTGPDFCLTNTGPFSNLQSYRYWSATEYEDTSGYAWNFFFRYGSQLGSNSGNSLYAWAVHPGDVGTAVPVPVPAAAWLLGSGLVGLLGMARNRRLGRVLHSQRE